MKKETHLTTIKIPYATDDTFIIKDYRRVYSIVLRSLYNRLLENENYTYKKAAEYIHSLNNLDKVNCHIINSAFHEAKQLAKKFKGKKLIFGSKRNFLDRIKHRITNEEFKERRTSPFYSIGEANYKANRFFKIESENSITFRPNKDTHITLNIRYRNKVLLNKLKALQDTKSAPLTYKLDDEYVYITYSLEPFKITDTHVNNRIMSIDLNPDSIGLVVLDWLDEQSFKYVHSEVISFKGLNDKEIKLNQSFKNKRHSELYNVTHYISDLAKYYKCEIFSMEDLNFKSKSKCKRTSTNRKNNNLWNRKLIASSLEKLMFLNDIKVLKVEPAYSSFVGNIVFNNLEDFCVNARDLKLPDMCLSAIELGRRAYEFYNQYIIKTKPIKKNLVFIELSDFVRKHITKSLEEFSCESKDIKGRFKVFKKNPKWRYRVPLDECLSKVFKFKHTMFCRYLFT